MNFINVESSNISKIAFENDKIFVTFHGNKTYSYPGKIEEFNLFKESVSKGNYFHSHIKGRPFEIVDLNELEPLKEIMT